MKIRNLKNKNFEDLGKLLASSLASQNFADFKCLGFVITLLMTLLVSQISYAYDPQKVTVTNQTPQELQGVGISEHLGQNIDLSLPFESDTGPVVLGQYFKGHKPVLLSIVYFECPSLCNYHLNGVLEALKELKWVVGQDFEVIAVSMDPRESAELASSKKANYVKAYGRPESVHGWHFLTGKEDSIRRLAAQVGFLYRWDEPTQQFAHASAAIILTSDGVISRYLHGIQPDPSILRMALLEAGRGQIGSLLDQFVMRCFHFDPKKSKYILYAWNIMRIAAVAMILLLAAVLLPVWWKQRRRQNLAA